MPAPVLVIHGGCGVIPRDGMSPAREAGFRASLHAALAAGWAVLARGGAAMDAVEAAIVVMEDDPNFNAGHGSAFNADGAHELDASIMDGPTLQCGAVAGVRTVKNPVSLARLVMTKTKHVLLMGDGAEQFATLQNVERVPNTHFDTEHRRKILEEVLQERARTGRLDGPAQQAGGYGTVGCVARDRQGRLAAATSTGGMTGKRWGRVGDTPVIGAGNWADGTVAISCTGTGEQFIRHAVAHSITARMQLARETLAQATDALVRRTLQEGDGGLIAVDKHGNLSAPFNSEGMYRGLADSNGRFTIRIFED